MLFFLISVRHQELLEKTIECTWTPYARVACAFMTPVHYSSPVMNQFTHKDSLVTTLLASLSPAAPYIYLPPVPAHIYRLLLMKTGLEQEQEPPCRKSLLRPSQEEEIGAYMSHRAP